jgi:type IX secretion system PorP/SprF family membrane protein
MKKLLAIIALGSMSTLALAQQDPQFSQNMYNKLFVNPGYAGSSGAICASALYRNQWTSFEGAPESFVLGIDAPLFNDKMGIGLSVLSDKIAFEQTLQGKLALNYKFNVGNGKLGAGIDLDFMQHKIDGDFKPSDVTPDPSIPSGSVSGTGFDLGGGLYYNDEKLYIGLSATHLLETSVDLDNFSKDYKRHFYGMIGYTFNISPTVALKPMVFVKNVTDNTSIDVNLNAHFNNRFWVGVSYRNEDAVVGLLGLNINERLRIGYSYDFTTSDVKNYSDGTHEIMLGYCFYVKKKITPSIRNVRFL